MAKKCKQKLDTKCRSVVIDLNSSLLTIMRSQYYESLNLEAKKRYEEKLSVLEIIFDPYSLSEKDCELTNNVGEWPNLTYADIYSYLINFPSQFTSSSLKSYEGLESYNYVTSGLVHNVLVKFIHGVKSIYIVNSRVRHGQSIFSKTPTRVWVSIQGDGEVINAHCTCMAGLGVVCSHIGATLFYLMLTSDYRKRNNDDACTSQLCAWLPPNLKEVTYLPLSQINFTDPKKKFEAKVKNKTRAKPYIEKASSVPIPSKSEIANFYSKISYNARDSVILRIIPEYSYKYIPLVAKLNTIIFNFYKREYEQLKYHELVQLSNKTFLDIKITEDEIKLISDHTKNQSQSSLWFRARAGVITASKFKACCHSNIAMPSKNLIMQICYPSQNKFITKATKYGCDNEIVAKNYLKLHLLTTHKNVEIFDCGLLRTPRWPYLGATPDGIMKCTCCSHEYIVEIKCPFKCTKRNAFELANNDKEFCMEIKDGKHYLKRNHQYYYQVQLQMLISNIPICYFIVYNGEASLIEKIYVDKEFLTENLNKARDFFILAILPELLAKWYSRNHNTFVNIGELKQSNNFETICTCGEIKESIIIKCFDLTCVIKTYHLNCLGLTSKPIGKWFCPYCCHKKTRIKKKKVLNE